MDVQQIDYEVNLNQLRKEMDQIEYADQICLQGFDEMMATADEIIDKRETEDEDEFLPIYIPPASKQSFVSSVGSARQDPRWNANLFSPINNNIEV